MKVLVYPLDNWGCGSHRLIWPAEALRAAGHDVTVIAAEDRHLRVYFADRAKTRVARVQLDAEADVVVLQRCTDGRLLPVIEQLLAQGVAVVVDVDDDLKAIHPTNPNWLALNPNRARLEVELAVQQGRVSPDRAAELERRVAATYFNSWRHLDLACQLATLVTVSTPALLRRYAAHGRGRVLENRAPDHYLAVAHEDSDLLGWPAVLHTHPNDPAVVGNALARLVAEGARFDTVGDSAGVGRAFGLGADPPGGAVSLADYPAALSRLGVVLAPLADTRFNAGKSWLKPLEASAVGVPWVASPRAEYARLHAQGAGLLADRPRDWYRALRGLLDDPARRAELSAAGREVAAAQRLSAHAWRWAEAWADAVELRRGPRTAAAPSAKGARVGECQPALERRAGAARATAGRRLARLRARVADVPRVDPDPPVGLPAAGRLEGARRVAAAVATESDVLRQRVRAGAAVLGEDAPAAGVRAQLG